MVHEENTSNVQRWIQYAKSDLDLARIDAPKTVLPETLCFHAQQAVEKEISIPAPLQDAVILTDYAVETRYPGIYEPVTDAEYEEAIHLAEAFGRSVWQKRSFYGWKIIFN